MRREIAKQRIFEVLKAIEQNPCILRGRKRLKERKESLALPVSTVLERYKEELELASKRIGAEIVRKKEYISKLEYWLLQYPYLSTLRRKKIPERSPDLVKQKIPEFKREVEELKEERLRIEEELEKLDTPREGIRELISFHSDLITKLEGFYSEKLELMQVNEIRLEVNLSAIRENIDNLPVIINAMRSSSEATPSGNGSLDSPPFAGSWRASLSEEDST